MDDDKPQGWPIRGQFLFALVFLIAALFLASQIGEETKWVRKTKFAAQPRFWPAVAIGGMVLFGALHLWRLPSKRIASDDMREWRIWFFAIEWVLWFLAYVWIVPVIGYLPATMILAPVLAWRVGYRDARMLGISVGFAVVVVVLFKSFLQVKIPGGAIYEYLPDAMRSFFILNF